jgi:hypothetical protein
VVEVDLLPFLGRAGAEVVAAGQGLELHVQQPRGVVGALEEGADAQEVQRLVLQHGAHGHAAAQVASGT